MRFWSSLRSPKIVPATHLCWPCQKQLQEPRTPAAFTGKLRVTKTRGDEVENDIWLVVLLHPCREFATVEDFQELRDGISISVSRQNGYFRPLQDLPTLHIGSFLIIQRLKDIWAALLWQSRPGVDFRGNNCQVRRCVEFCGRLP